MKACADAGISSVIEWRFGSLTLRFVIRNAMAGLRLLLKKKSLQKIPVRIEQTKLLCYNT